MRVRTLFYLALILGIAVLFLFLKEFFFDERVLTPLEIGREIMITDPLIKPEDGYPPASELTALGVLEWTNIQRTARGLTPLMPSNSLNRAAEMKIDDMTFSQYFDHISPTGEKIDDLVLAINYDFIAVGENLAMGDFLNDENLINGWMESPGHKENILRPGYREIGIAVKRGVIRDRETWIAVQVFALPSQFCPQPDQQFLAIINQRREELALIQKEIEELKREIEGVVPRDNQKIRKYNSLVSEYNHLFAQISVLTKQYNQQVELTNKCISDYGF